MFQISLLLYAVHKEINTVTQTHLLHSGLESNPVSEIQLGI